MKLTSGIFYIFFFIFYILLYFIYLPFSFAQYTTQVSAPSLIIDKMVGIPSNQTKGGSLIYVDNLGTADHKFLPGDEVSFQLKVRNTSNSTLSNVTVKDFVPSYLKPIEGPGNYDTSSRVITLSAGAFAVNDEKTYTLKMRVVSQDQLPQDKGLLCIINKATAESGNTTDDDTSQLCIEKQVVGVAKVPSAGPELGVVFFSVEAILLTVGVYLKRKVAL